MMRALILSTLTLACAPAGCGEPASALTNETRGAKTSPAPGGAPLDIAAWMKANAAPAMGSGDAHALERAFAKMSTFAPEGYADWATIAARGEAAAHAGDLEGCRATCKACHETHRGRYKSERRQRSAARGEQ